MRLKEGHDLPRPQGHECTRGQSLLGLLVQGSRSGLLPAELSPTPEACLGSIPLARALQEKSLPRNLSLPANVYVFPARAKWSARLEVFPITAI